MINQLFLLHFLLKLGDVVWIDSCISRIKLDRSWPLSVSFSEGKALVTLATHYDAILVDTFHQLMMLCIQYDIVQYIMTCPVIP